MFDLSGKVAVITGSSRGIGRSIAHCMADAGAKVVVSSRKAEACEEVAESIRSGGGEVLVVPCNISKKEDLENLVQSTLDQWGRLDILVCNAAVNPYYGPMATMPEEAYDKVMDSNVKSNFLLCNMTASHMAEQGGGSIIIISSIGGNQGSENLAAYGISKAADFALARNLAIEWGPKNITANCIAPGLIKTDFSRALWEQPKIAEGIEKGTPLRRMGDPDDIGGVSVFIASRAGAYLTGQTIVVDGGASIKEPA